MDAGPGICDAVVMVEGRIRGRGSIRVKEKGKDGEEVGRALHGGEAERRRFIYLW